MITFVQGKVFQIEGSQLLLLTPGGLGYTIQVTSTYAVSCNVAQEVSLYVYTHQNEEQWVFYGFSDLFSRKLFNLLLKAKGVGPRLAMNILDTFAPEEVMAHILDQDFTTLAQTPKLSTKGAQVLCVDIRQAIEKFYLSNQRGEKPTSRPNKSTTRNDTLRALVDLGLEKSMAQNFLDQIPVSDNEQVETLLLQIMQAYGKSKLR